MAWVLEFSESRLSDRLVLLALAEYAHDDGTMAFPSVETLAYKARVNERTCRRSLRNLEESGEIEPMGTTKYGTVIYRVLMPSVEGGQIARGGRLPGGHPVPEGGANTTEGGTDCPPTRKEPSLNPQGGNAGAGARETVSKPKIKGKPVKDEYWSLTEKVLAEFNEQTGSKLRPLTSAGKPSQAATRIYCRVAEYPDIELDEHADIIRRTLESRWWGDGDAGIGVVYGPNVFEDNIARKPSSNGSSKADRDKRRIEAMMRISGGGQL